MPSTMTTKGEDKKTVVAETTAAADGVINTGVVTDEKDTYENGAAFQRKIDKSKIPTCKIWRSVK